MTVAFWVNVGLVVLALSLLLCFVRLYLGPNPPNRTVAFDTIAIHAVGIIALIAMASNAPALLDAADSALIMSLVKKWQAETDQEYWDDFANFYQAHTVAKDVGGAAAGAAPTRPDPTSADLVLILHYSSILNPVPMASGFTWATAKEKADKVDELTKLYTPDIAGKVNFIKRLA